ncbi:MAG: hypothetical protein LBC92_01075 [Rickettsiales bacterium]|nr:hypothetical protein [Rickettsiales bacterium]
MELSGGKHIIEGGSDTDSKDRGPYSYSGSSEEMHMEDGLRIIVHGKRQYKKIKERKQYNGDGSEITTRFRKKIGAEEFYSNSSEQITKSRKVEMEKVSSSTEAKKGKQSHHNVDRSETTTKSIKELRMEKTSSSHSSLSIEETSLISPLQARTTRINEIIGELYKAKMGGASMTDQIKIS